MTPKEMSDWISRVGVPIPSTDSVRAVYECAVFDAAVERQREAFESMMTTVRPGWDHYFLDIAGVVATRSTCQRKRVGAALVKERRILSTGYGGSIRGQPHCTEVGCDIDSTTQGCIRTVHAEMNAIAQAAFNGVSTAGSTIYTTLSPCQVCFKLLANAGIVRIVYGEEYRIPPDTRLAHACGIALVNYHGFFTP